MSAIERAVLAATRGLSAIGLLGLMTLAVMTIADGLMRWSAGQPIAGVRDVSSLTIALAIACCLPVGLAERGNVTIRIVDKLGGRVARVLDVFASVLVLAVVLVMARQFYVHAALIARDGETTWVLRLPTAPFWYAVDVIFWCSVVVQAVVVVVDVQRLIADAPHERPQ
jgi:TRAP-type C4-dicarboxylate transport system permease small subunit